MGDSSERQTPSERIQAARERLIALIEEYDEVGLPEILDEVSAEVERLYRVAFAALAYTSEDRIGGSRMRAEDRRLILGRAVDEWQETSRG